MDTLTNTTYYPAILLRKRWLEAGAAERGAFDIMAELGRLRIEPLLPSPEVSALERWSACREAPEALQPDLSPDTREFHADVPPALPTATLRTLRPAAHRERQPVALRRRFHVAHRGGASPERMACV